MTTPSSTDENKFELKDSDVQYINEGTLDQKISDAKEELRKESSDLKKQYIEIFGIFAAIITFLGIEVQAFNKLESFAKLAGFSCLLMSLVVILLMLIRNLSSKDKSWKFFISDPFFGLFAFLFCMSLVFFWFEVTGKILWLG